MTPSPDYTYRAELIRVVDGDTIEVRIDCGTAGGELIVRTRPEPRKRQDSFRRYLAKVWAPSVPVELGEFLLSQHHAVPWTKGGGK